MFYVSVHHLAINCYSKKLHILLLAEWANWKRGKAGSNILLLCTVMVNVV